MPLGAGRSAAGDPGRAVPSLARQKQASTAERQLGASRGRRRSGLRQAAHRAPTVSALSPRPLAAQGPGATTAGHLGSLAAWAPPHRCCRLSEATRVHERFGGTTAFHRPPGRGAWRCPPCPASQEKRGPSGRMKLIWETRGPGEKGRATVCELEPHLMVTSSAPTAPNPLPGEVQGPVGWGRRPGRRPRPRPLPFPGSRRGMSVAIPGQRAVHWSPGSLSAGRAGPPPLCLPCPPPGGGTRQLSLHSELGLACFCPFCLPYTLNLIEFQGRFQSHLEYGKKKKGNTATKVKEAAFISPAPRLSMEEDILPLRYTQEEPRRLGRHRSRPHGVPERTPRAESKLAIRGLQLDSLWGVELPPESLAALIITLL